MRSCFTYEQKSCTYRHIIGVGFRADLADQRSRGSLSELGHGILGEFLLENGLALIERLVENNGGLHDALGLGESDVRSGTEEEVVSMRLGDFGEGGVGRLVVSAEVANDDDFVGRLELIEGGGGGEERNGGEGLLGHVRDDGVGFPSTAIRRDVLRASEDLERGVSLDAVGLAKVGLDGAVDFSEMNVFFLQ